MSTNTAQTSRTSDNHHPTITLHTPRGRLAAIDAMLVPVVTHCWRLGITTISCCQDGGETLADLPASEPHLADFVRVHTGRAYIDFASVRDAETFMTLVANGGTPMGEFYDRMSHWREPGAWDKTLILLDADMAGGRPTFRPFGVQITFPKSDIPEIAARLDRFSLTAATS